MTTGQILMYSGAILIGIIVIVALIKDKAAEKKREEKAKKQKEEQHLTDLNTWIDKINSKDILKTWVEDITTYCKEEIIKWPTYDHEFEFLTYNCDFVFGYNFAQYWYKNIKEFGFKKQPLYIFSNHFADFDLPEFKASRDANLFSNAMALVVKSKLEEIEVTCTIRELPRIETYGGDYYSDDYDDRDKSRMIYTLEYTRKQSNETW